MIIATASAESLTTADKTIAQADLPENVALFGSAVDTANPAATFSFQWTLLRKPTGSTASLSANNVSSPTLNNVDVWGNYRLFLIATNTTTGESSETDPVLAPNSAFTHVRVQSTALLLQKPAAGERDWNSLAHQWVHQLEALKLSLSGLTGFQWEVESNGATTTTTLPPDGTKTPRFENVDNQTQLIVLENTASTFSVGFGLSSNVIIDDTLTVTNELSASELTLSTGLIYGTSTPGGPTVQLTTNGLLIKETTPSAGSLAVVQSDVPSTTVRAGVLREDNLSGNTDVRVISRVPYSFTDAVEHTTHHAAGANNFTSDAGISTYIAGDTNSRYTAVVYNGTGYDVIVTSVIVTMNDIGKLGTGGEYQFVIGQSSNAGNFKINNIDYTANGGNPLQIASARVDGAANAYTAESLSVSFPSKSFLGVVCFQAPQHLGTRLTLRVDGYRVIG